MTTRIAFLTASEGIEAVELTDPWDAVTGAGHPAELLSPESGEVQLLHHLDKAETRSVDDYAALVLPGGVANPDALPAFSKALVAALG